MKICSPQLGISPISSLGGEIYDYQTLKGFTQKGVKVFVYLPKNRPYDKSLKNFYVDYCFMKHIFPPWIYSFISMPYLVRTYKKEKFDFLRIHSPRFLGLAAIFFHLLYPKVPIIASLVTVDPSPIFYPIEWLTFKVSKKIIVQSDYMKNILITKYKVSPNKIAVTYGGQFDTLKITKAPKQAEILNKDTQVLLFMGVLVKRKNPLFLADIFKEVKKEVPNSKLVIIGNGPLKKNLVKKLKTENLLDDSILIDYAYGKEKAYWLKRMNVFLMPSFDEGFGLAVTEAMSFGKPVITSDRAAFEEIITNGQNGYSLPLKIVLWVKTITALLKSPNASKKIGTVAQRSVQKKFNWSGTHSLNYRVLLEMVK
ncbi:hypothetical protein A2697_01645 [Candidatus Curtissbacteria bacterium RIFCSPHIGHO2_01_FULL_41_44]|uniref:Glycosyl transferase family 1 domain-containing protein n=1 Tax=Candidatus Curtissbacteria bacterium RIFCSPLOWO2_01_FULL_42_50 TaxID=1797730 RepID=A0A1F5H6H6_9BACT|nr:MAG: hypothetical protein A2697_01645 [Candidatus Curtissbacteria bacterium RIFCSPHIGHO2_01_FULL_41_44]OGD99634.1 MAG: hypothetical protein A3B54_03020 [Candidatus Curtissbacteria bacterium RIFCSPLOWO2_01_FULL_42_50]